MTKEQVDRLFGEFCPADTSTARRYGGTRLGLGLSRRPCRLMGGEIVLASQAGRESMFAVRLPRQVVEPRPETAVAATEAAPGASPAARPA
jgi:signal transduction histidine kinase